MTDSRAAVGLDRLPWLADEPKGKRGGSRRDLAGWALAAALALAGGGYWLGKQSVNSSGPDHVETAVLFDYPFDRYGVALDLFLRAVHGDEQDRFCLT